MADINILALEGRILTKVDQGYGSTVLTISNTNIVDDEPITAMFPVIVTAKETTMNQFPKENDYIRVTGWIGWQDSHLVVFAGHIEVNQERSK